MPAFANATGFVTRDHRAPASGDGLGLAGGFAVEAGLAVAVGLAALVGATVGVGTIVGVAIVGVAVGVGTTATEGSGAGLTGRLVSQAAATRTMQRRDATIRARSMAHLATA
jgi:hypothetical protein